MKNAVIITAKGGNTSIPNKNCLPVLGVPVVLYPIRAALSSSSTEGVFVSTEDAYIRSLAESEGVKVITRPPELAQPGSEHKDVILHAVNEVKTAHPELENVCVLLGNTVQITAGLIDKAFAMLETGDCDSVVTVWKAQDDHPYRALRFSDEGYVESFLGMDCGSNRQSYPPAYYYDQGIWAFQWECAKKQEGPNPWVWLGKRCAAIERPWVTGRDVHGWIDLSASVWYLTGIQAIDHIGYSDLPSAEDKEN